MEDAVKLALGNPKGDELMEELRKQYGDRISYHPDMTPEEVAFREGERNIYLTFKTILEDEDNG
jgi:hypothetical protein